MKVSDLQRHLADLGRMLDAAGGARGVAADLTAVADSLRPFQEYSLRKFADFLLQAEALNQGAAPPPKGARKQTGGKKPPKPDPEALAHEVRSLYDGATDSTVTEETIASLMNRLEPLTRPNLVKVAAGIELKVKVSARKEDMVKEIHKRISERRATHQRSGLLGRPTPTPDDSDKPTETSAASMGS